MKNNKKKAASPAKKLIPAAGMLMISATMLATSTLLADTKKVDGLNPSFVRF